MIRNSYSLTPDELDRLDSLEEEEGVAWEFWGEVAHSRGLDYRTVIGDSSDRSIFTAMPYNHGKDWCHPMPLQNTRKARWNGKDVYFV